jgi:hypothetical protein
MAENQKKGRKNSKRHAGKSEGNRPEEKESMQDEQSENS